MTSSKFLVESFRFVGKKVISGARRDLCARNCSYDARGGASY